jgi:uncharacterized membrane protein
MPYETTLQASSDRPLVRTHSTSTPIGDVERLAAFVGGVALTSYGLRHSLGYLALIASGSALIYHALKGTRPTLRGVGESDGQSGDSQWH